MSASEMLMLMAKLAATQVGTQEEDRPDVTFLGEK